MPRYQEDQLAQLKTDISLQRLVEAQGIELKKHGKDYIGLCPFHEDTSPSLVVSVDKNLWHCFGACSGGGSVIDWVMKSQGVSFRHAVEILQNNYPSFTPGVLPSAPSGPVNAVPVCSRQTGVANHKKPVKRSRVQKLDTPFQRDTDDQQLLNQVIDFYQQTLKQSPAAQRYLEGRGLVHPELIDTFKLGYANRTLGYRLPRKDKKAGATLRGQLQRIGLYRASGHEHFNGSLVIPVIDEHGNVTEVYGRKITKKLRPGTPYHLYLPGPHQGVFNQQALKENKEIILCESLIDAITFWCAGYKNVTSSYGIEGFTDETLRCLQKNTIQNESSLPMTAIKQVIRLPRS